MTTAAPTTCVPDIESSDFTEVGAIDKWTEIWQGARFNLSVIDAVNTAKVGAKDLKWDSTSAVSSRRFASFDPPGECRNVEILTLLNAADPTHDQGFRLYTRASGAVGSETCYYVNLYINTVRINKYVAGAGTTILSTVYKILAGGVPLWFRFRVEGTSLKLKIWPYNSFEPVEWGMSTTDSSITDVGKVGIGQYYGEDYDIMYFAVGVGGSSPPVPALTTGDKDRLCPKEIHTTYISNIDFIKFIPFRIISAANTKYAHAIRVYLDTEYDNVRFALYKGSDETDITDAVLVEDLGKPALAIGWNQFSLSSTLQLSTGDILYVGIKSDGGPSYSTIRRLNGPTVGNISVSNASGEWDASAGISKDEDIAYPANLAGITAAQSTWWYPIEVLVHDSEFLTTLSPTTTPPTTAAPTTAPPTTIAPTTAAPTTAAPTPAPTTIAPTTTAPTTIAPTTLAPTTVAPTTAAPTTAAPTPAPTTIAPTTAAPTTSAPTTVASTTAAPTPSPTTIAPTTIAPTVAPTTTATTSAPTTAVPGVSVCDLDLSSVITVLFSILSIITKQINLSSTIIREVNLRADICW